MRDRIRNLRCSLARRIDNLITRMDFADWEEENAS
jgi:hypothetical protein